VHTLQYQYSARQAQPKLATQNLYYKIEIPCTASVLFQIQTGQSIIQIEDVKINR
jgi:hypothetical protein